MNNNDSKALLNSVLRTTQMGQTGIRSVRAAATAAQLQNELDNELNEYDSLERSAMHLAQARNWKLSELPGTVRGMAATMSRLRLAGGNRDSKIAGMLIQGNTRGMITGLKNLHRTESCDQQIIDLAQQLVERETENIRKTQAFL